MPNFQDLVSRDPEEVGIESYEDTNFRANLAESIHTFEPGPDGRCIVETRKFCYEHNIIDYHNPCNADKWSVLHPDEDGTWNSYEEDY